MRRCLAVTLVLVALIGAPAAAQTCLGLPSFANAPFQVTGAGWLASESSSYGAGVGYGSDRSVFGALSIGSTRDETVNGSAVELGAKVGYQVRLGKSERAQLCPVAAVGLGIGPNNTFNSGVDRSNKTVALGLAFATSFFAAPRADIIPTVGLAYAYRQDQAQNAAGASLFDISYNSIVLQLGIGVVLNTNVSIRPLAELPLGITSSDPTFGLTVGYNFGRSRHAIARDQSH